MEEVDVIDDNTVDAASKTGYASSTGSSSSVKTINIYPNNICMLTF
jgi:hypothetical protein